MIFRERGSGATSIPAARCDRLRPQIIEHAIGLGPRGAATLSFLGLGGGAVQRQGQDRILAAWSVFSLPARAGSAAAYGTSVRFAAFCRPPLKRHKPRSGTPARPLPAICSAVVSGEPAARMGNFTAPDARHRQLWSSLEPCFIRSSPRHRGTIPTTSAFRSGTCALPPQRICAHAFWRGPGLAMPGDPCAGPGQNTCPATSAGSIKKFPSSNLVHQSRMVPNDWLEDSNKRDSRPGRAAPQLAFFDPRVSSGLSRVEPFLRDGTATGADRCHFRSCFVGDPLASSCTGIALPLAVVAQQLADEWFCQHRAPLYHPAGCGC